jgi:Anti-sigma-D factor RsdA to sigma factor binding region
MSGRDDFSRAGYRSGDRYEAPADLAAVQADDALLDMLGRGHTPTDVGDELTRVLAAWRREVRGEPVDELVDVDTAAAVIRAARRPVRRRNPVFGSIAVAAAVFVIAFSGVGLFAKSAQPNDQLWGVTQVLYPDYARSVETAAAVRTELSAADKALRQGDTQKAKETLQSVQQKLSVIAETEGRTGLTTRHRELEEQLNASPGTGSERQSTTPESPESAATSGTPRPDTPPLGGDTPNSTEPVPTTETTPTPDSTTAQQSPPTTDPRSVCRGSNPPSGCPRPDGNSGTGISGDPRAHYPEGDRDPRAGSGGPDNGHPGRDDYPATSDAGDAPDAENVPRGGPHADGGAGYRQPDAGHVPRSTPARPAYPSFSARTASV